jgi:hypothetical protein
VDVAHTLASHLVRSEAMDPKHEPMMVALLLLALAAVCGAGCAGETELDAPETETSETETGPEQSTETSDDGGEPFHPSIVSVGCSGTACVATFGEGAHAQAISECRLAAMISSGYMQPIASAWPLASCEQGSPAPESLDCFAVGSLSTCYAMIDGWAVQVTPECEAAEATGSHWPNHCDAGEPVDGAGLLDARCDAAICSASLGPDFGHARVRLVPACMADAYQDAPGDCAG